MVGERLDIWITEYQNHVKESIRIEYQSNLKHRIKPAISAVKLNKLSAPMTQKLYDEKIREFLEVVKDCPYRIIFTVDLFTGMRQGEILGLSWDARDFQRGTIIIEQQLQKIANRYRIVTVKNDRPRIISPAKFIMNLLLEQKVIQNQWRLKAGIIWKNPNNLVFTNELGDFVFRDAVYEHCKPAGK